MKKLSSQQLAILDALWWGRVGLGSLFLNEHAYISLFNVPWHHLCAADCCRELAKLLDRGYLDLTEENWKNQWSITIGWTRKGSSTWSVNFLNNIDLFIVDETTIRPDSGIETKFICSSLDNLQILYGKIANLISINSTFLSAIKEISNWEAFTWRLIDRAFEFRVASPNTDWLNSQEYFSIMDIKIASSRGWRKRPIQTGKGDVIS